MNIPDKESIMQEVHDLATEARSEGSDVAPVRLTAEPQSPSVAAPIYMGKAHEVVPDSYVLHYSVSRCANCGTESRDNQFFALSYIKSRTNGTRVRHLIRCDAPWYNLPVRVIPTGTKRVPFCCECQKIDLSHLPPPPQESQLYDLAEPVLKNAKPKAPKPESKKPTLDDLI